MENTTLEKMIKEQFGQLNGKLDDTVNQFDNKFEQFNNNLEQLNNNLISFIIKTESRFETIETELSNIKTVVAALEVPVAFLEKSVAALQKEFIILKRSVLRIELEYTKKVDILYETRVDVNDKCEGLDIEVGKLNEVTEIHTMQIEFLKNKCNS